MTDIVRGIKAGIVSGIVYGIIIGILSAIVTYIMWDTIFAAYESFFGDLGMSGLFTAAQISLSTQIISGFIGGIIGGVIFGLIFGLIYAALYNSLPGSTSMMKGIVLMLIVWLILSVGLGFFSIGMFGMTYYIVNSVVVGLIGTIIWGYLLGTFWDKFGTKSAATPAAE